MTLLRKYEAGCKCGYAGEVEFYDSINIKLYPELKNLVKKRIINGFTCPKCGGKNELLKNFLYTDTDNGLWIWCYPERQRGDHEKIKKQIDSDSEAVKEKFGEKDFIEPKIVFGFDELLKIIG
jgi:hypothetical protein